MVGDRNSSKFRKEYGEARGYTMDEFRRFYEDDPVTLQIIPLKHDDFLELHYSLIKDGKQVGFDMSILLKPLSPSLEGQYLATYDQYAIPILELSRILDEEFEENFVFMRYNEELNYVCDLSQGNLSVSLFKDGELIPVDGLKIWHTNERRYDVRFKDLFRHKSEKIEDIRKYLKE